ncbi:MAG TPA: cation:proton antiporter subunit C [Candidatus Mcinerneyibacteriales bacterium]|jgi:multisubunit Na+/H+ antiporter MnhC subunit|nr:cation:proton antiporter subunit C [Candidatus Mcinerneyibacteriales bacterium]HPE21028.1 cation:proton antiporter subunit C [Candidatus Mcinerneyibacteriales bacterium]HPJ70192.1 cation:proton antiporter subunit C [Candidatus Mcinerneyibacteriales bacterium]HPQ89572.1 cation:proton antiporter subunit C [Candidatus Mcinerneyibacteriales bacterium]
MGHEWLSLWSFLYGPLAIFLVGLYGLLTQKNLIKMAISINIMDYGVNLFIISLGYVPSAEAPIYTEAVKTYLPVFADPLPQALVLTAIVISVAVTAFILALTIKIHSQYGTTDLTKLGEMEL